MGKIRVAIVEDDPDWLKAMIRFLNKTNDLLIIGTATNKEEAILLAKDWDVDVILMDINLSENKYDGIYAAIEIGEVSSAKIIMLTSLNEEHLITQ